MARLELASGDWHTPVLALTPHSHWSDRPTAAQAKFSSSEGAPQTFVRGCSANTTTSYYKFLKRERGIIETGLLLLSPFGLYPLRQRGNMHLADLPQLVDQEFGAIAH